MTIGFELATEDRVSVLKILCRVYIRVEQFVQSQSRSRVLPPLASFSRIFLFSFIIFLEKIPLIFSLFFEMENRWVFVGQRKAVFWPTAVKPQLPESGIAKSGLSLNFCV